MSSNALNSGLPIGRFDFSPLLGTITGITFGLATLFVVLRIISRIHIARHFAVDDWLIVVSWAFALGLNTVCWVSLGQGLGSAQQIAAHVNELTGDLFAFAILYTIGHALPKFSVLVYYLSISRTSLVFRNSVIAVMVLLAITSVSVLAAIASTRGSGTENIWIVTTKIYLASSPANILVDFLLPLLPIPTINQQLVLKRRQRLVLYATLGCGGLMIIASVARVVLLQKANDAILAQNFKEYGMYSALSTMWSFLDVNLSVAITCVPALKPIFTRWLPKYFRNDTNTKDSSRIRSHASTEYSSSSPVKGAEDQGYSENTLQVAEISFVDMFRQQTCAADIGASAFATAPGDVEASAPAETKEMQATGTDIDFVVLKGRSTLHDIPGSQSWRYLWRTAILYALIGFTTSFPEALTRVAKTQDYISSSVELLNRNVFYGAYLVGPILVAYFMIRCFSFKGCSISGLLILAVGCLIFWPAAILGPTPGGIGTSYFTIGAGTSVIETGASLYSFLAGPPQYAATRVLILHFFQALGSVIAPIVVRGISKNGPPAAEWAYLVLAMVAFLMLFWYQSIPANEFSDTEIEEEAARDGPDTWKKLKAHPTMVYITLVVSALGLFAYAGGAEDGHSTLPGLMRVSHSPLDILAFEAISRSMQMIGRLICGVLCIYVKPRLILLGCATGCLVGSCLVMKLDGLALEIVYLVERAFQGSVWPLGFIMICNGMGRRTRLAAVLSTTCGCGPLVFPSITYALVHAGRSYHYIQSVTVGCFIMTFLWAVFVNIVPIAKLKVDGFRRETPKAEEADGQKQKSKQKQKQKKKKAATPDPVFSMDFITTAWHPEDDEQVSYGPGPGPQPPRRLSQALGFVTRARTASRPEMEMQPYRKLSEREV